MRKREVLSRQISHSVIGWVRAAYNVQEVVLGLVEPDEDEPERWLVDFAIPIIPYWQVAEVWVEDGAVVSVNDLGEGVPPEGIAWPWPEA